MKTRVQGSVLFWLWLPLSLSFTLMMLESPVTNAALARFAEPSVQIAGFGVALGLSARHCIMNRVLQGFGQVENSPLQIARQAAKPLGVGGLAVHCSTPPRAHSSYPRTLRPSCRPLR